MIRMGRSSKPDLNSDAPQSSNGGYSTAVEQSFPPVSNRVSTESESMARDIKEGRLSGFIGSGTMLTGDTNFQTMLRIDGHLTGSVTSEAGTLVVGSSGRVDANISVAAAVINGTVNGDVSATEKLELGRSARVVGNIQSPRLIIEEGALLEGSCSMVRAQENAQKRAAEAVAPRYTAESFEEASDAETPVYVESGEERSTAAAN